MDQEEIGKRIAAAGQVAADLARQTPVDSAYVAGSLTAGLGNAKSDVDLFILSASDSVPDGPVQFARDGGRIDVEWLTLAQARRVLDALAGMDLTRQRLVELWPHFDDVDWYARFLSSVDVINSPALEKLRAKTKDVRQHIDDLIVVRWALGYNSSLEDFHGAVIEHDYDTASYSGSAMTVASAKAYVASLGDIYIGHKWVYKQLRRSAPLLDLSAFSYYSRGHWVAEGDEGANRMLSYGQTLLGAAALNRLADTPLPELPTVFDGSGPRRATEFVPMSIGDSVLLHHESGRQVKLTARVALVWLWCTGPDLDTVVENVLSCAAALPGVSLTASQVRTAVERLVQSGLVRSA
ncbi:hypothetical protein ABGB16_32765 [Micromonospora sp. B11E3]|uniref:hypothetical protein n=1 Tax=Micromonospora sp. B11E3 TaxID=3153562 RepID=UPI00325E30FA